MWHSHNVSVHYAIQEVAEELDQQGGGGGVVVQEEGILQLL